MPETLRVRPSGRAWVQAEDPQITQIYRSKERGVPGNDGKKHGRRAQENAEVAEVGISRVWLGGLLSAPSACSCEKFPIHNLISNNTIQSVS